MADRGQWRRRVLPASSAPGARSPERLLAVIRSADVVNHPRYAPLTELRASGAVVVVKTWCKTFVWDVTSAMGVEVPHWVKDGESVNPTDAPGAHETRANDVPAWCDAHPETWHACDHEEARQRANAGHPVVAAWFNPAGIGHVAMGIPSEGRPRIAQAGIQNFESGGVEEGFGARPVRWWWAD